MPDPTALPPQERTAHGLSYISPAFSRRRLIAAGLGALAFTCLPRSASANRGVYIVQRDDTLWDIATSLGVDPDELAVLNGIDGEHTLMIGQELKVPGEQPAPAPVKKPALVRALAADGHSYVVQEDDTLIDIAGAFGVHVDDLRYINGLGGIQPLVIGQSLIVPPKRPAEVEAPKDERAAKSSRSPSSGTYVVQPGDTLWDIATAMNVDVDALAAANGAGSSLMVGQEIVVPGANGVRVQPAVASVPFRTQLDGNLFAASNCGPAALGMLLEYHGEYVSTNLVRRATNRYMGSLETDLGTTWEALAYAAKQNGFGTIGLYAGEAYRSWRDQDVFGDGKIACPILALAKFPYLPGHENASYRGDHYIVLLGRNARGDAVYHDPAFADWTGAYRTMSAAQLDKAWARTWCGQVRTGFGLKRL